MATVGYGELSPATGLPRTNAVLEALTGQIFLPVLVARLVRMYTGHFGGVTSRGESPMLVRRGGVGRCPRTSRCPKNQEREGRYQTMRTTGTIIGRRLVRSLTNLPRALRVWRLSTSMSWAPSRSACVTATDTTWLASSRSSSASGA